MSEGLTFIKSVHARLLKAREGDINLSLVPDLIKDAEQALRFSCIAVEVYEKEVTNAT